MKKMLLLFCLLFFTGQIFSQKDTVFYQYWIEPPSDKPAIPIGETGYILEGETFTVIPYVLPGNPYDLQGFQGLFNAFVGGTFGIDDGAINNNIRLDICLSNLSAGTHGYHALNGEPLFLFFEIMVTDLSTGDQYSGDNHFYFNDGKKFRFYLNLHPAFFAFAQLAGIDTGDYGFAYFINDEWVADGIETVAENGKISFIADHLSKFGGGRSGIGNTAGVIEDNNETPENYNLLANYPNPFNPSTKITFNLTKDGFTTLKVYNLLGREVATLISEYKDKGSYEVEFNAADLPSGVYLYELRTSDSVLTEKMLLLR